MVDRNGAQGRNRTTDTAIFSRMLYQLSYLGVAVGGAGNSLGARGDQPPTDLAKNTRL